MYLPKWLKLKNTNVAVLDPIVKTVSMDNEPVRDWIVPISQPVLWLFQPPRSGGTMLTRLFDGHPEIHVNPIPLGYSWPNKPDLSKIENKFNLAKFDRVGFKKHASNRPQTVTPIYFDEKWFRTIIKEFNIQTTRDAVTAGNTAVFNAWRNYQNLYGAKRYVMIHSTAWRRVPLDKRVPNFFTAFPDGYAIFIARPPEDWLASGAKLERSQLNDMELALEEYVSVYETYLSIRKNLKNDRMNVLEFNSLVRNPKEILTKLCDKIGVNFYQTLEVTTFNGISMSPNSSHAGEEKIVPDISLIGKGEEIIDIARSFTKFKAARQLYEELKSISISQ